MNGWMRTAKTSRKRSLLDRWPQHCAAVAALAILGWPGMSAEGRTADKSDKVGKADKAYIESRFHMLIPGLRDPSLRSRVVGNQLYTEHVRDIRVAPYVLRYEQSVPLSIYDLRSSFDSVSDLYFDRFEDARAFFDSEEIKVGDGAWTKRLTGGLGAGVRPWRPNSKGFVVIRDHVMVDGTALGPYRWISFMKRKEGASKEQVDTYMRDVYAPALAKLPGIRRYVFGTTYRPAGADAAGRVWALQQNYDAVDMIWFDSLEDMTRVLGSVEFQERIQRAAEVAVIDQSQTVGFATETYERLPFPPRYSGPSWEEVRPASAANTSPAPTHRQE